MSKRIPAPCSPENCGDNYSKCGKISCYQKRGCRCAVCTAANTAYGRRYYDPAAASEYNKQYRADNKAEIAASKQKYHEENRDQILAKVSAWQEQNPDRVRANVRASEARRKARKGQNGMIPFTAEQLDQRMAYYGYRCYLNLPGVCTGAFDDVEHVKPLSKGGPHMLANLRPACDPCNTRKFNKWPFPAVTSRVGC